MDIVLIRHAERKRDTAESGAGLTPDGQKMAQEIADRLQNQELKVEPPEPGEPRRCLGKFKAIFTSTHAAPKEMAEMLRKLSGAPIYPVVWLTPPEPDGEEVTSRLFDEAKAKLDAAGSKASDACMDTIAVVGHEPVVSGLLCQMTGKKSRSLDRGEAVWLTAKNQEDFKSGNALLVYASRSSDYAERLHDKIQTKMTVCTFLAGFVMAALIEIIKDPDKIVRTSRVVAAICFTMALALLIAAVYVYDNLSMPPMFWRVGVARGGKPSRTRLGHDRRLNGALYAYMVHAWLVFFTPAVLLSLVGSFAFLLFNLRYPHLVMREATAVGVLIGGCVAAVAIAVIMYYRMPKLAVVD